MKIIFAIGIILAFASCVKEPLLECPYQYKILLSVKDKNYSNSFAIDAELVDENLPFRQYVSNIYYTLQDINTGKDIITPIERIITGEGKETEIILNKIPDGEYLLTVWGNVEKTGNSVEDPSILHENKEEDTDEYIASEQITIKTGTIQEKSIGLERIKGKLVVTFNNLPEDITKIMEDVTSIYQNINNRRIYSQKTDVEKTFLKSETSLHRISTFLAPTTSDGPSMLSLELYKTNNNAPTLTTPPIELNITRNEITAVNINYTPSQDQLEIWVYIDNQWTLILELNINEI